MIDKQIIYTTLFLLLSSSKIFAQTEKVDVSNYQLSLEPNITNQSIQGNVIIEFSSQDPKQVSFDCGQLTIDSVKGETVNSFIQNEAELSIAFNKSSSRNSLQIFYHGTPTRGAQFSSELEQAYTVFSTEEWMPCNSNPDDKATIEMELIIPNHLDIVASGMLMNSTDAENNKTKYFWKQTSPTPAYTYGFAIGSFNKAADSINGNIFNYYSADYNSDTLASIFKHTPAMLKFFEEISGVPYFQTDYSQVLMGSHYQEMSGFSVLKKNYGNLILKDSTEINLISHELAHQWWGNAITCESWSHFWLNEAFATFMSAAYNERQFGRDKYLENINAYYDVYQKVKSKGADKPLVFKDWIHPTGDDRNLVYFKGAYVLHLLREELGDDAFWAAIKSYSQQYYGKSVNTELFQQSIEKSSQRDLSEFFKQWIY
ncbi:M1 family metallopeptidase [Fulvivirga ligni]|uniref:M1 family metallopeptidase n=1 Tax=Fulvivirga ligni TaxID=2904246 RepID=UPI001F19E77F|nr:M1 family metallopeptidase [Fulvivirga ligni]UII23629.1 M1 family metallopeptidase [Fulvivirga ligni]